MIWRDCKKEIPVCKAGSDCKNLFGGQCSWFFTWIWINTISLPVRDLSYDSVKN